MKSRSGIDMVRVRDKATGHHYTIRAASLNPEKHEPVKSPAVDRNGYPIPPKHRLRRKGQAPTPPATPATEAGQEGGQS